MEERLEAMLAAPIGDIVSREHQVLPSHATIQKWDIPRADHDALSRWGLPVDTLMTPDFQRSPAPLLTPNVAGDVEGRLIAADQRLYRLGWWGSSGHHTPIMGVVARQGRVLGLRKAPLTAEDLHPHLREHYTPWPSRQARRRQTSMTHNPL